jgi:uncharacterized protein YoxC
MYTSLIVAAVALVAILYLIIRSRKKEAHHLDDIHIGGEEPKEK